MEKNFPKSPQSFDPIIDLSEFEQDRRPHRLTARKGLLGRNAHTFLTFALAIALVWSCLGEGPPARGPPPPPWGAPHGPSSHESAVDTASFFKNLYAPFIHRDLSVPATYFSDVTNLTKTLHGEPTWTSPLGKEVLILDLDTRAYNGSNQLLDNDSVAWNDLDRSSAGMLNHYMYSLIHGYDYKFVRAALPSDRFASWTKPSSIATALLNSSYRFVVFADADALWNHPEIPLESLLNHWNVSRTTSLSVSLDPGWCVDSHAKTGLNTGFIVAQNNARTREILQAWAECPDGARYPHCGQYKNKKVFEQTAFNEYVRYDFSQPHDIHPLPCDDTDGYPGSPDLCNGELVRHFWREKDMIKGGVGVPLERLMEERMRDLRDYFVRHAEDLYVEE